MHFNAQVNQKIIVTGKAMNAKAGAVVVSDRKGIFYLEGLHSWDKKFQGNQVEVRGFLLILHPKPKSKEEEMVQEIAGAMKIIKSPSWKLKQ